MTIGIFVPPFGPKGQWFVVAFAIVILFVLWSFIALRYNAWDWLLISGWATFILGILLANQLPNKLDGCLRRLVNRDVLRASRPEITESELSGLQTDIECVQAPKYALWIGSILTLSLVVSFLLAFEPNQLKSRIPLLGAEAIGAYIAGCYLGRMVCYGRLGRFLKSSQLSLRVDPAHPDMAGGLKPIGDFFFFQAAIAGLPALFLAIWLVLISFAIFPGVERYEIWAGPYAGLLMLAIAIEVTAFILPLWFFHGQMKTQKKLLLKKADELSAEIAELRTALGRDADSATREQHKNALSDMVERWRALEECPVWPMDVKMKRRFAVNNVVLLLPAIGQYTGLSRGLSKLLAKIVEANFS